MLFLRQSTASQEILLGPFVDSTDGNTAETALTINNTDIKIWVEGATTEANKNSGGATHIASGRYYAVLDATDTATVGKMEINVHVAGALAVRREFMVLEEAVYDALFAASAPGYLQPTTAGRTLDVTATGAAGIDWGNVENPTTVLNLSGTTVKTATDVETDTADIQARLPAALVGGRIDANVGAISGDSVAADNLEAAADGTGYNLGGGSIVAASVTGAVGSVTGAVGSVTGNVGGNVTGSVGSVATGGITAASIATGAIDADALATDAVAEIADGVWDEALSGHLTAGSTGNALNAAGSAGDPWSTTLPGSYTGSQAGKILSDVLTDTAEIGTAGAGLTALAPAATALSTATWTGTRAGYLDNLSGGAVALASGVNVTQISGDSVAADNLEAMLDGTGGVTLTTAITGNITGNLSGSVGSVSGAVGSVTGNVGGNVAGSVGSVGTGGIAAASFAANSITASALAADAVSEIQSGLSTLDAGGVRTAVGLASANLDTQLSAIAGYIDTETAAILADTTSLLTRLTSTRAGYLDNLSSGAVPTLAQILAGGDVDGYTVEGTLKLLLAALAGKLSGAATTTVAIRAADDSKARITATVDADGNRSAVTLDATG